MLLLGVGSEIFSNMFWIREEGSVYFNIREEESVIQASLRGGGVIYSIIYCHLLCLVHNLIKQN